MLGSGVNPEAGDLIARNYDVIKIPLEHGKQRTVVTFSRPIGKMGRHNSVKFRNYFEKW